MHVLPKLLILGILLLGGCGPAFLPQPTSKPVAENDVVGCWTIEGTRSMTQNASASRYTTTICFRPDYTFTQSIQWSNRSDKEEAIGTWSLNEAHVLLNGLLMEKFDFENNQGIWILSSVEWWMANQGDEILLFGGLHGDPDSFGFFKKEKTTNILGDDAD